MKWSEPLPEAPSVRELAALFGSMVRLGVSDRGAISDLLRRLLENHPRLLGTWCLFEPEIFGGNNPIWAGQPGHDEAGRFLPRWERSTGRARLTENCGHDSPTLGGWFLLTRECREEIVFGPYNEGHLSGYPVLGLAKVAPIMEQDRFLGVAGIDVSVDALREAAEPVSEIERVFERWHVFLHADGTIAHASRQARRLLARYAGTSSREGDLPDALRGRLQEGPVPAELCYRSQNRELRIHAVRHPYSGDLVLSLAERQPTRAHMALSKREHEVFRWLEQGKTNAEIAVILGISGHTVRHHLESIFAKLGVENRTAAIRFGRRTLRSNSRRPVSFVPEI